MSAPNLFLVYVQDAEAATSYYSSLFEIEPTFTSPRYIAFEVAPNVLFALWTGQNTHATPATPRTSEIGLMIEGGAAAIDAKFAEWHDKGAIVIEAPHDDVFGRTFVVSDPDGNLIRVAPID